MYVMLVSNLLFKGPLSVKLKSSFPYDYIIDSLFISPQPDNLKMC